MYFAVTGEIMHNFTNINSEDVNFTAKIMCIILLLL